LLDRAAAGDGIAQAALAAATQLTGRDEILAEARAAGEAEAEKYAEDRLVPKVARWAPNYDAAKVDPNYKTRAERETAP
jgi:hypothetical protein